MVRTFLQVAAGAADIPVTRLLGQSPAGLSATGDSDTRNYYDMVSSRQEIDLRPQLERLDALMLRSADLDPSALTFEFRPLWQLDAAEKATVALSKAQATAVYAGLTLWPADVTAKLVQAQLVEDGIYPNAEMIFAEAADGAAHNNTSSAQRSVTDYPGQPRDPLGQFAEGKRFGGRPVILTGHHEEEEEEETGGPRKPVEEPETPSLQIGPRLIPRIGRGGMPEGPPDPFGAVVGKPGRMPTKNEPDEPLTAPAATKPLTSAPPPVSSIGSGSPFRPGLIVKVTGSNAQQRAQSYQDALQILGGFEQSDVTNIKGDSQPDGVVGEHAMEAKYIDKWAISPYNPDADRDTPIRPWTAPLHKL